MMNYEQEISARVDFIKNILKESGAKGVIYGNSGGKDCTLVGILCKRATEHVLAVMMPCSSKQNYDSDLAHAKKTCEKFHIDYKIVDLTDAKNHIVAAIGDINQSASANIAPRLRMTTLYAIGQTKGYVVAGTGNRSERYVGYFTKWGDGACDFNPIADLTTEEIYALLRYLGAPEEIINKAPSAGLFDGQTDEGEMGITYKEIEDFMVEGIKGENYAKIEKMHKIAQHKLMPIPLFERE